jgi:hypothetical protein
VDDGTWVARVLDGVCATDGRVDECRVISDDYGHILVEAIMVRNNARCAGVGVNRLLFGEGAAHLDVAGYAVAEEVACIFGVLTGNAAVSRSDAVETRAWVHRNVKWDIGNNIVWHAVKRPAIAMPFGDHCLGVRLCSG